MIFTNQQINEIIEILNQTSWLFIARNINPSLVPKNVLKDLIKLGFKTSQVVKYPELAMQFGMLSVYLKDSEINKYNFHQLKQALRAKKFIPLSEAEKFALRIVEQRATDNITGLGNKIGSNIRNIIIEGDLKQRKNYEKIIKNEALRAVKYREGVKNLSSGIGKQTNDWARDLDRISYYIIHDSANSGIAMATVKEYGEDALVYVRVHDKACKHCKRLYLKNEKTWEPKIFKISELFNNGTNIGRKVDEWKSVIPPVHPWCNCWIVRIPKDFKWSIKDKRFIADIGKHRDLRSKIKIRIS